MKKGYALLSLFFVVFACAKQKDYGAAQEVRIHSRFSDGLRSFYEAEIRSYPSPTQLPFTVLWDQAWKVKDRNVYNIPVQ